MIPENISRRSFTSGVLSASVASVLPLSMSSQSTLHAALVIDRTKKPEPGPAPEASFPAYREHVLKNGLRIFHILDDRKPTVTLRLMIKSGAADDGAKAGVAGITATLLNRGTKTRDAVTFAKETDGIGSRVEASAGSDASTVGASALSSKADAVLGLLADAVLNPIFPADQFEKVRKQVLSALQADREQPRSLAGRLASKLVYGEHPYGASSTPETVKALGREDAVAFHQTHYVPGNATLAVIADRPLEDILPLVEKHLGAWTGVVPKKSERPEIPALPSATTVHLIDRPGSVQSYIDIVHRGPGRSTQDLPEINVVNATLGGGFSGRLFQNLREKNGWTYGAYSAFDLMKDGGSFSESAETRNDVTHLAVRELLAEAARIRTELIPEDELALQREYNVGNYLLSLERPERTVMRVQDIDLYGLDASFYRTYAKRMAAVTPALAKQTAERHVKPGAAYIVVVGEAKEIRAELEKFGSLTVYDVDLNVKK
jgi:predicted Zn-dependent peptidase